MRKNLVMLAGVALTLGLASCGSSDSADTEPTTTITSTLSTTSSSPTTTSSSTEKSTTVAESAVSSPEPVAADPTTAQAVTGGIWSQPGVGYRCAATDAWVYDPSNCVAANLGGDPSYDQLWGPSAAVSAEESYSPPDNPVLSEHYEGPANIPIADGGTCPAALCGYGHDEYGNPNPSSGEIQGWWMDCIAVNTDEYCRANDPYTN
jgi:hypothetical protein